MNDVCNLKNRPGLAIAAEILGYVVGGVCVLGAISEKADVGVWMFLIGGGFVAMSIFMRQGLNWARITFTVLAGLMALLCLGVMGEDDAADEEVGGCFLIFVAVVCSIVFSWLPKVNQWFRSMSDRHCVTSLGTSAERCICEKCGMPMSCDSKFCANCGTAFEEKYKQKKGG